MNVDVRALALVPVVVVTVAACAGGGAGDEDPSAADTGAATASMTREARCYRSDVSVLLGPSRGGTSEGRAPGWIRLEGLGADSGMARLTDTGGAGLQAVWRRVEGDSIHLAGFDDFLRVEMRLAPTESRVAGRAVASSDAAAERDSTGRPRDLRREWNVAATLATCDSMPAAASDVPR